MSESERKEKKPFRVPGLDRLAGRSRVDTPEVRAALEVNRAKLAMMQQGGGVYVPGIKTEYGAEPLQRQDSPGLQYGGGSGDYTGSLHNGVRWLAAPFFFLERVVSCVRRTDH
jgi:hypothetical protein